MTSLLLILSLFTFTVNPQTVHAARNLKVTLNVSVTPREGNCLLAVIADGDGYYRASEVDLNGEKDIRFHRFVFRDPSPGRTTVLIGVFACDGTLLEKQETTFTVIG